MADRYATPRGPRQVNDRPFAPRSEKSTAPRTVRDRPLESGTPVPASETRELTGPIIGTVASPSYRWNHCNMETTVDPVDLCMDCSLLSRIWSVQNHSHLASVFLARPAGAGISVRDI